MKRLLVLLLFIPIISFAQEDGKIKSKYYHRNKAFVEQRATPNVNSSYAESYYNAWQQKQQMGNIAFKKQNSWTPVGPSEETNVARRGRINSITFHPNDTATYYICVAQGGLWKTTNSGASWTNISGDLPILRTSSVAVDPNDDNILYLATGDMAYIGHNLYANENKRNTHYGLGIYKSTDGGESWKPTGLSFVQTDFEESLICDVMVHPNNSDIVIAATTTGFYYSDNAGLSFTKTQEGLFWDLKTSPNGVNELFASTGWVNQYDWGEAGILRSTDYGKTWIAATVPFAKTEEVQRIELATSKSAPNKVYALATDSSKWQPGAAFHALYVSTDTGKTFTTITSRATLGLNILGWSLADEDGGQGTYDLALWVDDKDDDQIHIGGVNIWTSKNGGASFLCSGYAGFTGFPNAMHADIHEIEQHPTTGRTFVCHDGGISSAMDIKGNTVAEINDYIYSTKWTPYNTNLHITSFYRVDYNKLNKGQYVAGAQDNSTQTNVNSEWIGLTGGDGMECAFDTLEHVYTSYQYGNFYWLGDFGGNYGIIDFFQRPFYEVAEWTTPFSLHETSLYIGYGQVHKQLTFGVDEVISDFPQPSNYNADLPISALYISPSNAQRLYIAKRGFQSQNVNSEFWVTTDEGKNWTNRSSGLPTDLYPTYITANSKVAKNAWVTFAGFEDGEKIYATKDYGKNWENVSYNLPNIPVNCVEFDRKTKTLFVGTDLGVFYLPNGADEWLPLETGFPNVIVSELKINTEEEQLIAASFGAGLWTYSLKSFVGEDEIEHAEINIYPNPAADVLTIDLAKNNEENLNITVVDMMGRKVLSSEFLVSSSENPKLSLDVSKLLSGQYFVIIQGENTYVSREFLKVD
jgi:photosystem II stability/assembly factor-like uncharacterized protein